MGEWVFGIDGGGTTSRIRAETLSGRVLYTGAGPGTNPNSNERRGVIRTLGRLISGALASGLAAGECKAGFIGSAGVDRPDDVRAMKDALSEAFDGAIAADGAASAGVPRRSGAHPRFGACNDSEAALVGALDDVEGFLLIAGTGSIAYGRTRTGESARAGGWGHFLGDEGSAFWIAFEGIKRGIRSSEGREPPSRLLVSAIEHFALSDAMALIPFVYNGFDKAKIASYAPIVTRLSAEGDIVARAIVARASIELTALVESVYRRLELAQPKQRLALYGGLLEGDKGMRSAVIEHISEALPSLSVVEPKGDAPSGACALARALIV